MFKILKEINQTLKEILVGLKQQKESTVVTVDSKKSADTLTTKHQMTTDQKKRRLSGQ